MEDTGGGAEVVAGCFEADCGGARGGRCELGVEGSKVVEDVGALELEVILRHCPSSEPLLELHGGGLTWSLCIVTQRGIPRKVRSDLSSPVSTPASEYQEYIHQSETFR